MAKKDLTGIHAEAKRVNAAFSELKDSTSIMDQLTQKITEANKGWNEGDAAISNMNDNYKKMLAAAKQGVADGKISADSLNRQNELIKDLSSGQKDVGQLSRKQAD